MDNTRIIAWFSCGAASAVASKLAVEKYGERVSVVYCDTMKDEHPDNQRFFDDVQEWLGVGIERISNPKYSSVDDVFEDTRYMAGVVGARCTVEMKKRPRFWYESGRDVHVFGFTADEKGRIDTFKENNPEMRLLWILQRGGITKADCLNELKRAGIKLPAMYLLGFRNNNCLGCVKATSARYWNMIRMYFPEVFEKRAQQSRKIGCRLTRYKGERIFLDELPEDYMADGLENISCGPECSPQIPLFGVTS